MIKEWNWKDFPIIMVFSDLNGSNYVELWFTTNSLDNEMQNSPNVLIKNIRRVLSKENLETHHVTFLGVN